ncbi:MAG: hypothetical protein R2850_02535 [Bacteroidia bacterium]
MFQGLTLELDDTLLVEQNNADEVKLTGSGNISAYRLHGADGILSKKNKATGIHDIEVLLDLKNGILDL